MADADFAHPLRSLLRADFEAFIELDDAKGRTARRLFDVLTHPGFLSVVLYRLSAEAHRRGLLPVARLLLLANFVLFSAEVSPRLRAGPGLVLAHPQGVAIGAGVTMGSRVRVLRNVAVGTAGYKDPTRDGFPVIGDGVLLCDSASVFGPVTVGDGVVVGADVTLFESVPEGAVVVASRQVDVRLPRSAVAADTAPTT